VVDSEPQTHGLPGKRWTLKKLRRWLGDKFQRLVSKATLHKILHAAQVTWKKCKKLLGQGDGEERAAFVARFLKLYEQVVRGEVDAVGQRGTATDLARFTVLVPWTQLP